MSSVTPEARAHVQKKTRKTTDDGAKRGFEAKPRAYCMPPTSSWSLHIAQRNGTLMS